MAAELFSSNRSNAGLGTTRRDPGPAIGRGNRSVCEVHRGAISCANCRVPRARITAAHHSAFRAPQL